MSNVRVTTKGVHKIRELTSGRGRTRYRRTRNSTRGSEEGSYDCLVAGSFCQNFAVFSCKTKPVIDILQCCIACCHSSGAYLALETVPFVGVFDLDGYVVFVVDLLY